MMKEITVRSLAEINDAADEFISAAGIKSGRNRIFAFYGSMGAGKTTFIAALCSRLGVEDQVSSPTFTIVNEYRSIGGRPVYHFDFYRVEKLQEILDMGFGEYMYESDGLCLMEWPEKLGSLLPEEAVKVTITESGDGSRVISF